jgi:hypothetical protein
LDLLPFFPELDVDGLASPGGPAKDKTGIAGIAGSLPGPFNASTRLMAW